MTIALKLKKMYFLTPLYFGDLRKSKLEQLVLRIRNHLVFCFLPQQKQKDVCFYSYAFNVIFNTFP